jgi:recombinational DNA repair protein (RecF pathway)
MTEAVSRRHLTAEARVRDQVTACMICGGQSETATGFSPSSSVFSCQHHSNVALHSYIPLRGWLIGPLVAAVQRFMDVGY